MVATREVEAMVVASVVATPLIVVTKSVVIVVTDLEKEVVYEVDEGEDEVSLFSDDEDESVVVLLSVEEDSDEDVVGEEDVVGVGVVVGVVLVELVVEVVGGGVVGEEEEEEDEEVVVDEEVEVVRVVDEEDEVSVTDELDEPCRLSTAPRACISIGSAEATAVSRASISSATAISSDNRLPILRVVDAVCTFDVYDADGMCVPLFVCGRERLDTALDSVLPRYAEKLTFFGVSRFWVFVWASANFICTACNTRANFSRPSSRNSFAHVHILARPQGFAKHLPRSSVHHQ
jgi:hypothetical protein